MNELYDPQNNAFKGGTYLSPRLAPARHAHASVGLPFYDTGRFLWTMALADSIAGKTDYEAEVSNVLLSTQFEG
jgi:hypothetical protein